MAREFALKAGYLVYSFNLGAETAVLRSRQTYDDGQFHMVRVVYGILYQGVMCIDLCCMELCTRDLC